MKKQIIITGLFFLISFTSFAQYDIKDFLKYKQADLQRHELSFLYDLQNNYLFENNSDSDSLTQETSEFNLNNNLNSRYLFKKNTRKYIGSQSVSFNPNYSIYNNSIDSSENKNTHIEFNTSFNSYNRFYFREKLFYNLNFNANYYFNKYSNTYLNNDEQVLSFRSSDHFASLNPEFSLGIGRIEPLTDVIHAIVYVKTLNKKNRITGLLDANEIMEFAKLLAETKNKRFLDSRHKKIYELEKIDSFLNKNDYIKNKDIIYFTNLEDIWVYAGNYERNSGNTFSVNFQPMYQYIYNSNEFNIHNFFLSPSLSFTSSKPVNILVQRNFYLNAGYNFEIPVQDLGYSSNNFNRNLFLSMEIMYGFYPSTRTVLESSLSINYNKEVNFFTDDQSFVTVPVNSTFNLHCYYYISPKIRVFIDSKLFYNYMNYQTTERINNNFFYSINAGFELILY